MFYPSKESFIHVNQTNEAVFRLFPVELIANTKFLFELTRNEILSSKLFRKFIEKKNLNKLKFFICQKGMLHTLR